MEGIVLTIEKNIEEKYIEQYQVLHKEMSEYGASSVDYFEEVSLMIEFLAPETVLDYGCGKGKLTELLSRKYPEIAFYQYDPAIKGKDVLPIDCVDFLINTDVLEHIPKEIIPSVIEKIASVSNKCFFALHHAKAAVILPNGENAHCTIELPEWYIGLFKRYFKDVIELKGSESYLSAAVTFPISLDFLAKYDEITKRKRISFTKKVMRKIKNGVARYLRRYVSVKKIMTYIRTPND